MGNNWCERRDDATNSPQGTNDRGGAVDGQKYLLVGMDCFLRRILESWGAVKKLTSGLDSILYICLPNMWIISASIKNGKWQIQNSIFQKSICCSNSVTKNLLDSLIPKSLGNYQEFSRMFSGVGNPRNTKLLLGKESLNISLAITRFNSDKFYSVSHRSSGRCLFVGLFVFYFLQINSCSALGNFNFHPSSQRNHCYSAIPKYFHSCQNPGI